MRFILVLFAFLLGSGSVFAQNTATDIQVKVHMFVDDVYQGCGETITPEMYDSYLERYGRVEIVPVSQFNGGNYILLSGVPLKDKCNPGLTYDSGPNFNPEAFNPFKYRLSFFSSVDKAYRVDNSDYIILIHHL